MADMSKTRKIILAVLGLLAIALIIGALWKVPNKANAQVAPASTGTNPFGIFWNDLIQPFTKNSSGSL